MASFYVSRYGNHCLPSEVVEGEDCQICNFAGSRLCTTNFEPEEAVCNIGNQSVRITDNSSNYVVESRSFGQPFFTTGPDNTPRSGAFSATINFEYESGRSNGIVRSSGVSNNVLGIDTEDGVSYPMDFFGWEVHLDTYGGLDNNITVEASLSGQNEINKFHKVVDESIVVENGQDSTTTNLKFYAGNYSDTLSTSSPTGQNSQKIVNYGEFSINNLPDDAPFGTSTTSVSLRKGGLFPFRPISSIIWPEKFLEEEDYERTRPFMLFGRSGEVWKLRINIANAGEGSGSGGNKYMVNMYVLNSLGSRA